MMKVIGDDIYVDGEKVAVITALTSITRDKLELTINNYSIIPEHFDVVGNEHMMCGKCHETLICKVCDAE